MILLCVSFLGTSPLQQLSFPATGLVLDGFLQLQARSSAVVPSIPLQCVRISVLIRQKIVQIFIFQVFESVLLSIFLCHSPLGVGFLSFISESTLSSLESISYFKKLDIFCFPKSRLSFSYTNMILLHSSSESETKSWDSGARILINDVMSKEHLNLSLNTRLRTFRLCCRSQ